MSKYAELTVLVPVSQYVKVEAAAAEKKHSPDSTASFLLSQWVLATQSKKDGAGNRAMSGEMRRRGETPKGSRERSEAPEGSARGRAQDGRAA